MRLLGSPETTRLVIDALVQRGAPATIESAKKSADPYRIIVSEVAPEEVARVIADLCGVSFLSEADYKNLSDDADEAATRRLAEAVAEVHATGWVDKFGVGHGCAKEESKPNHGRQNRPASDAVPTEPVKSMRCPQRNVI